MDEKFKRTKHYAYIKNNMEEIEKDRIAFNKQIADLLRKGTDELGTVLKCHLILEYYLDLYLKTAYPTISQWEKSRLTFNQKLELLNHDGSILGVNYKGIKCLNSIRNKFSHKLSYSIVESDCVPIRLALSSWYKEFNKPIPKNPIRLIEGFTVWVCGGIYVVVTGINKHSKNLGLPGYLIWLKEMAEEEKRED